ncbi:hypothetical protein PG993_011004 [Apiospora rasikravindrae]|uniref:Uncharacterized protein n=1 Tax=Apiospora rasikravindrae TaxID=990691 RepID=A0ABR1SEJ0_9PEZI
MRPWLGQRQIWLGAVRVPTLTATRSLSLHGSHLALQQRHESSTSSAASASDKAKLRSYEDRRLPNTQGASRPPPTQHNHATASQHPRHVPEPAQRATAPTRAPPVTEPLPGQIAKLLNLVDTHRSPLISYLPETETFVRTRDKRRGERFEHRKTVNTEPQQMFKIKLYDKIRASLVKDHRIRGPVLAGQQRLFAMHGANTKVHPPLGDIEWELDSSRLVRDGYGVSAFERKNTKATLEVLPNNQAALLWITIVPERPYVVGGSGLTKGQGAHHYKWASLRENLPWYALADVLKQSPNRTLKVPSVSPSSPDYQLWPGETSKLSEREVAERVIFMHVMPLFMQTYGPGGYKHFQLWQDGRRNDNLPVVFSWQQQYVWCIWRNGPTGPLEFQQTGHWIPEVAPGHRNYQTEQAMMWKTLGKHDPDVQLSMKAEASEDKASDN